MRSDWYVVLVCGGRDFQDDDHLWERLSKIDRQDLVILQGGARGADTAAKMWAENHGVPCIQIDANWEFYNKAAGRKRNEWMASILDPDFCLAFPTKKSKGTWMMVNIADDLGIPVEIVR